MKQPFALPLILWSVAVTTLVCQVQGGIITNQQSLTLPDSLAAATASNETSTSSNGTRSGRVMYTAPYSNVRIASKEPKSLDKYFPIPAVVSKKAVAPVANIVPVLHTSTSTSTSTTTTTTTSTTTTTTPPPPPSTSESVPEEPSIPEIMEVILEEADPINHEDEVVTETTRDGSAESTDNDEGENNEETVTEPSLE